MEQASEQVPFGIYAIEKNGCTEFQSIKCKSMSQLKRLVRDCRQQGFKVHFNNGR